LKVIVVVYHAV